VRDDRPRGRTAHQLAVWFAYSPDRKGEHPQSHLSNFTGTLQADGYAGFNQTYEAGRIQESSVLGARTEKVFYDLEVAHKSPVAAEAFAAQLRGCMPSKKEIRWTSTRRAA